VSTSADHNLFDELIDKTNSILQILGSSDGVHAIWREHPVRGTLLRPSSRLNNEMKPLMLDKAILLKFSRYNLLWEGWFLVLQRAAAVNERVISENSYI
jgi:hypothetical protein